MFNLSNSVAFDASDTYERVGIMTKVKEHSIVRLLDCHNSDSSLAMAALHARMVYSV